MTQKKLASLAGVSTPTLSRFENGGKDIQLSSIMGILTVLGMVDSRTLVFSDAKARYDSERGVVLFSGQDGEKRVHCAIGRDVLDDYYRDGETDPLKMFTRNRERIEHEARKKYLADILEPDGSIFLP